MRRDFQWCWLGVFIALLGAGCYEPSYSTPGLYNRRNHPLDATLRVARGCGAEVDLRDPDNYGAPVHRRLFARDLIALRSLKSLHSTWDDGSDLDASCTAVWLELPGHYEAVLVWNTWHAWDPEGDPYEHSLVVEGTRDDVVVRVPAGMTELEPPEL